MAPKNMAKAAPKAEPKAKKSKPMVVADDPTPAEMKAIIQRMLNLVKYKADPLKNKSGDRLTEAQEVLEAGLHLSIVRHWCGFIFFGDPACARPTDRSPTRTEKASSLATRSMC